MKKLLKNVSIFLALILAISVTPGCDTTDFEFLVPLDPIVCDGGIFDVDEIGNNVVINGGGGDCIRAEGNCVVSITADDIILNNCRRCIDAKDTAEVALFTSEDIKCSARQDGIRIKDDAFIGLDAFDDVTITSSESNGIRAEDTSTVELIADDTCTIEAAENPILREDNAVVDTDGCNNIDFVESEE